LGRHMSLPFQLLVVLPNVKKFNVLN